MKTIGGHPARMSPASLTDLVEKLPPAVDLLKGAEAIAEFLLGDPSERRIIYHLASTTDLPVFRLGAILCARRSVLIRWIGEQEVKAAEKKAVGVQVKR